MGNDVAAVFADAARLDKAVGGIPVEYDMQRLFAGWVCYLGINDEVVKHEELAHNPLVELQRLGLIEAWGNENAGQMVLTDRGRKLYEYQQRGKVGRWAWRTADNAKVLPKMTSLTIKEVSAILGLLVALISLLRFLGWLP